MTKTLLLVTGVLANEAKTNLVDYPDKFYCDWPMENVTISHRAATAWPEKRLQRLWNNFVNQEVQRVQRENNNAKVIYPPFMK